MSSDSTELYYAHMEADRNEAERAYFNARPGFGELERSIFRAGYERAYQKLWPLAGAPPSTLETRPAPVDHVAEHDCACEECVVAETRPTPTEYAVHGGRIMTLRECMEAEETCERQNTSGDAGNQAGWDRGGGASDSSSGETRPAELCGCYSCSDFARRMSVMITCPECGNKRCPKATHHIHACTRSNAPGQPGSRYYEDVVTSPNRGESL